MKKEVVIVIILGITIGSIVAYGIYIARTALQNRQTGVAPQGQETTLGEPTPQSTHTLTLVEPKDESIVDQEKVTISGITSPDSVITILGEENEYLLTADAAGNFSAEISLVGGANTLTVISFDEQGNRAEAILTVVYSTAEL